MSLTESDMLPLGSALPDFVLPDVTSGKSVNESWLADRVSVVAFICNHCPFVVHLKEGLAAFGAECASLGVRMIAVSSNDVASHPMDGPLEMARDARRFDYQFPYLYDETQDVARSFGAVCTPDFFVYDRFGKLAYRGQFDASRPNNGLPVTGEDLRAATLALLAGGQPSARQSPSIGCNIKWRAS